MINNIIFDFGEVLVNWDPRRLYVPYFGDAAKADWFLKEICPYEWNAQCDSGRLLAEVAQERVDLFPEWEKEIRMYFDRWIEMIGGEIPGSADVVREFKQRGYGIYGITNWSAETFPLVRHRFPVFDLMDGMIVSGEDHVLKPNPEIYNLLLSRYGLKAEECVFIDDNPRNAAGAEAVGIRGLVFKNAAQMREDLNRIVSEE